MRRTPAAAVTNIGVGNQVAKHGYVFLAGFRPGMSSSEAIRELGLVEQISNYDEVHDLTPRPIGKASRNSYSGNFGCDEFPLHTDFAHWFNPPRYLVLRCVVGASDVKTRVADSRVLLESIGASELSRALVQPRTSINGQRPLLRIFDQETSIFRWDTLFLAPSTRSGVALIEKAKAQLAAINLTEFCLLCSGDTLIVDNWRFLHGRSAVKSDQQTRKIERAYLSSLHDH